MSAMEWIALIIIIIVGILMAHSTNKDPIKRHEYDDPDLKRLRQSFNNYKAKRTDHKKS